MEDFIIEYEKKSLRKLEWFDKITGHIVGQEELKGVDLMQLREIFNVTIPFDIEFDEASEEWPDPYMIDCYPVDLEKKIHIDLFVKHHIKLDDYNYYVSCSLRKNP